MNQVGIKETKEMLEAVNVLVVYLIEKFKDGVQASDFIEMYSKLMVDPEFKSKLMLAYENANQIPAEIKDVDLAEAVALISLQVNFLPKVIEAIKKE